MTNVLLLSCRSPFLDDSKIYAPMANLYLKSYIERHVPDARVTLGDDNYNVDDLKEIPLYDYVGISVMTPQREEARKLLTGIKVANPKAVVIGGGPHFKHYLDEAQRDCWDHIVPNDGERALVKILTESKVPRIVYDVMSKDDIARAPRPDRSSLNAQDVIRRYHYKLGDREATTMMTARGCPEQCTFCEDALTAVKWSSLENLCGEMDDIKAMGYKGVYIFDDLFAIAEKKVEPICNELKKRDIIYRCNGQVRYFTRTGDSFAEMLGHTGCVEIAFGFESGSQKILNNIKKRTTVEQNYQSVKYAHAHGIKVKGFIMCGLPGETKETLADTERFIAEAGMDDFQLACYTPFKGTQIRAAIDRGESIDMMMVVPEVMGAYGIKGGETSYEVRTGQLSADEIKEWRNKIVARYKPKAHTPKWNKDEDNFFEQGKP